MGRSRRGFTEGRVTGLPGLPWPKPPMSKVCHLCKGLLEGQRSGVRLEPGRIVEMHGSCASIWIQKHRPGGLRGRAKGV